MRFTMKWMLPHMTLRNKSHRHIVLLITTVALTGCASTDPEVQVRLYYTPMVAQALEAQQHKPLTQPTHEPRQIIHNTSGRAVGYIR